MRSKNPVFKEEYGRLGIGANCPVCNRIIMSFLTKDDGKVYAEHDDSTYNKITGTIFRRYLSICEVGEDRID